ncbi:MAG: helix-turn-helix domain-containing protein [Oscillospiraceae bacterium]|nr:helix-turn-helix domain-containing protein [Oscillospiraceae bacterium]
MRYDIFKYPRLRDLRVDRGLAQKEIAAYLKVKPNTYSRYETGAHNIPLDALEKLADFHNTSVDYLLGRTDESVPYPGRHTK